MDPDSRITALQVPNLGLVDLQTIVIASRALTGDARPRFFWIFERFARGAGAARTERWRYVVNLERARAHLLMLLEQRVDVHRPSNLGTDM